MNRVRPLSTALSAFLSVFAHPNEIAAAQDPSSARTYDIWQVVRKCVDSGAVDPKWSGQEPSTGWSAVVLLRREGKVIGVGQAHGVDNPIRVATEQAIAAARVAREPSWRQLTVEIELGEAPVPAVGSDYSQAGTEIDPALEGAAVRRGNAWMLAHPAVLQALDAAGAPEQTFLSLVMQHGLPAREFAEIPASERVALAQFSATRIVQPTPDAGPVLVHRGARLRRMPTAAESPALARATATAIAQWFERSMIPAANDMEALGLRGDYEPSEARDNPIAAPPAEQALAAYALARFSQVLGISETSRAGARRTAVAILAALGRTIDTEADPLADARARAFIVLAHATLGATIDEPSAGGTLARNVIGLLAHDAQRKGGDALETASTLAAMAMLERTGHGVVPRAELRAMVDAAWDAPDRARLLGVLDWLIIADRELGDPTDSHAALARTVRMALARAQLGMSGDGPAVLPDLVGAFSLSGVGGRGASGQSARPGHALALMLADPSFTPVGEQFRARAMQIALLRFLDQLAYDEVACYLCPDPRRALGALRTAPWDSTVAVAGNAMALLCLSETADALDRINSALPSVESSEGRAPSRPDAP